MWWEILPSAGIVYALFVLPHYVHWGVNKLDTGRAHRRNWLASRFDYHHYMRDERISGSTYKPVGLEAIPEVD